ncbi:MAG: tetratricopeptide repeat protein [Anaerolineales bacterium]|nr:tetratricopeptide repeat protein [Anaerolineales bacterium]
MYGQALAYQRKFEQAENSFDAGLKVVPVANGLDDVYLKYIKYLVERKRFERAEKIAQEAMARLPLQNLVRVYVEYSKLLRKKQEFQKAVEVLEEGIQKIPSKFNLYSLYWEYCDLLKSRKDYYGAIAVLKRGIKHVSLKHKGDALILEYGKLARNLGNKQEAEKALKYGIQNTPVGEGLKILYLDYAKLLLFQRRYNEAISCLDEALGRLPKRSHGILKLRRYEITEEMKKAQQRQDRKSTKETFENQYFQKGQYTKPYLLFKELLQSAVSSIVIIDSYVNEEFLKIILTLKKEIPILIISKRIKPADFGVQVNKLRRDGYKIKVYKTDMFHDRFIGIDNEWIHSGHSFKDIGSRVSMSTKLDEKRVQQLQQDIDYVLNNVSEFC